MTRADRIAIIPLETLSFSQGVERRAQRAKTATSIELCKNVKYRVFFQSEITTAKTVGWSFVVCYVVNDSFKVQK